MASHREDDIYAIRNIVDDTDIEKFYETVLKEIAIYQNSRIRITIVPMNRTKLLVNKVIRSRLERAHELLRRYQAAGLTPFEPIAVRRHCEWFSIVSPPATELSEGFSVMDGSHRVVAAHQAGLKKIVVIVIDGLNLPPAASDSYHPDEAIIVPSVTHWVERTVNFRPALFRPVPMALDRLHRQLFNYIQMRNRLYGIQ